MRAQGSSRPCQDIAILLESDRSFQGGGGSVVRQLLILPDQFHVLAYIDPQADGLGVQVNPAGAVVCGLDLPTARQSPPRLKLAVDLKETAAQHAFFTGAGRVAVLAIHQHAEKLIAAPEPSGIQTVALPMLPGTRIGRVAGKLSQVGENAYFMRQVGRGEAQEKVRKLSEKLPLSDGVAGSQHGRRAVGDIPAQQAAGKTAKLQPAHGGTQPHVVAL